jgi:catechol 2,3-dioxygenase-like lactoylglutathione lyase family enzyme
MQPTGRSGPWAVSGGRPQAGQAKEALICVVRPREPAVDLQIVRRTHIAQGTATLMTQSLSALTVLVQDYDEAIAFYVGTLDFELLEDTRLDATKRWVRVRPHGKAGAAGTSLLLARAATPEQLARVGDQTSGRVFLFLETDKFWEDYERWRAQGVRFLETPREESYGTVVVFQDLYGNRWDLIEPRTVAESRIANTVPGAA